MWYEKNPRQQKKFDILCVGLETSHVCDIQGMKDIVSWYIYLPLLGFYTVV